MAHLLAQPQQKLQLNYKTTINQNCQKIKLYRSATTKELKKSYLSRGKGGGDVEWAVLHPCVVDKNWEGYLRSEGFHPKPDHPAHSSSTRKISSHNFPL